MMNIKICPQCKNKIDVPKLDQYEDFFSCEHCYCYLSHDENEVFLYAVIFIVITTVLFSVVMAVDSLLSLMLAIFTYHFVRPMLLESVFGVKVFRWQQGSGDINNDEL